MCLCHCRFGKRPSQWWRWPHMNTHKQVPTARLSQKTVELPQPQFIDKVVDVRVTRQRQVPQSQWRREEAVEMSQMRFSDKVVDSSCTTENRQQRTDATGAVPEREAKANPSPESSEEDRNLTVTACTGNHAIWNRAHDAGKDCRRARYSQLGCCQDCQRNSPSLEHRLSPVRDLRYHPSRFDQEGNGDAGGSRSTQTCADLASKGDQQSEINLARKQQDCDSVEQQSSVQDPGAHAQPKQKLTRHHSSLRCHEQGSDQQSEDLNWVRSTIISPTVSTSFLSRTSAIWKSKRWKTSANPMLS